MRTAIHDGSFALLRRILVLLLLLISVFYFRLAIPVAAQKASQLNPQSLSSIGVNNQATASSAPAGFTLRINVPSRVSVTVDGVHERSGSIVFQLSPGMHTISVPETVQIDLASRLRFDGWDDGSLELTRTLDLENDTEVTASYVTQYYVSTNDCTLASGWYDVLAVVQLSVKQTWPNEYRLYTGGFDGWYSDGRLVSESSTAPFVVYDPVNVTARWNYLPFLPPILLVVILGAILILRGGVLAMVRSPKNTSGTSPTRTFTY